MNAEELEGATSLVGRLDGGPALQKALAEKRPPL